MKKNCANINSSGLQSYPSPPEWTEWSPWSSCSCKGKRSRERNCTLGGVASSPGVDHLVNFLSFFSSEVSVLPASTCPGEREEMELCGEESYLGKLLWPCDKFGISNDPLNGLKILITYRQGQNQEMINCSWHSKRSFWRFFCYWRNRFPGASCPDGWTQFDESCYYLSKAINKIIINIIIISFYTQKYYW